MKMIKGPHGRILWPTGSEVTLTGVSLVGGRFRQDAQDLTFEMVDRYNSHDALVELNKELVEALETAISTVDNNLLLKTYWEETLDKAKELLKEQEQ